MKQTRSIPHDIYEKGLITALAESALMQLQEAYTIKPTLFSKQERLGVSTFTTNGARLETVFLTSRQMARGWKHCFYLPDKWRGAGNGVSNLTTNGAELETVFLISRQTARSWKHCSSPADKNCVVCAIPCYALSGRKECRRACWRYGFLRFFLTTISRRRKTRRATTTAMVAAGLVCPICSWMPRSFTQISKRDICEMDFSYERENRTINSSSKEFDGISHHKIYG